MSECLLVSEEGAEGTTDFTKLTVLKTIRVEKQQETHGK